MISVFQNLLNKLLHGKSPVSQICCLIHQESVAYRGGKRVYNLNLSIRKFLQENVLGNFTGISGAGYSAG